MALSIELDLSYSSFGLLEINNSTQIKLTNFNFTRIKF